MYKDKDKQKAANRAANKRYRERKRDTMISDIPNVIPESSNAIPDGTTQIGVVKAVHQSLQLPSDDGLTTGSQHKRERTRLTPDGRTKAEG